MQQLAKHTQLNLLTAIQMYRIYYMRFLGVGSLCVTPSPEIRFDLITLANLTCCGQAQFCVYLVRFYSQYIPFEDRDLFIYTDRIYIYIYIYIYVLIVFIYYIVV